MLARPHSSLLIPPTNHTRGTTSYDWCDCGTGAHNVTVWPRGDASQAIVILSNTTAFAHWSSTVAQLEWSCDGMASMQTSARLARSSDVWSMHTVASSHRGCAAARLRWNTWTPLDGASVPFTSGADGFACVKIPTLLRTHAGTTIAMAEARTPDCSDFARTVLVYKRSEDGGATWSELGRLPDGDAAESRSGLCGAPPVVGNAAPVQLSLDAAHHPGRILVPHVRDNFAVWLTHSDDDGLTWSTPRELVDATLTDRAHGPMCNRSMAYFGVYNNVSTFAELIADLGWGTFDPYQKWRAELTGPWQFVGLGPPASIELKSGVPGRILVPGYHSYIRGLDGGSGAGAGVGLPISQLYNNFALGHVLTSDDGGDTWRLRNAFGTGGHGANENQMVELGDGSVLMNSRALATGTLQQRVQARSEDGGESWTPTRFVGAALPEPFNGCQGSIVGGRRRLKKQRGQQHGPEGESGGGFQRSLYFSHPNGKVNHGIAPDVLRLLGASVNLTGRDHMTIWRSDDEGVTYTPLLVVDEGAAGYSALSMGESDGNGIDALSMGDSSARSEEDSGDDAELLILYEQSDPAPFDLSHLAADALLGDLSVLDPDRIVLRRIALGKAGRQA